MLFTGEHHKTVKVKGNDVKVKSRTKKDDTDTVKVSLWRDLTNTSALLML